MNIFGFALLCHFLKKTKFIHSMFDVQYFLLIELAALQRRHTFSDQRSS
ncbi:hypothetical protein D1BOALGB6SA_3246 [Olavius sp. associated proteobacterium Delta 1]|nr:hypothetical protein D1BOALGB6SA_3246 [Olavius sp. associated proteobacterium Delta 1]